MTKIEWTDETWNPVTGCTKVSQGCKNCYAERMAYRLAGRFGYPERPNQFKVTLHPDLLDKPLKWKKPRRVFVNSMSDLFHPDVPFEFIRRVYKTMWSADWHTYQILTKRPERAHEVLTDKFFVDGLKIYGHNIWIGVSVEDQKTADKRIPWLLKTPAAVRFVSYEPALEYVDFGEYLCEMWRKGLTIGTYLDWIICGGESGPNARPMHPDWARLVRDQCNEAGVPFFFKQWGGANKKLSEWYHLLDGREWHEYPTVRS